MAEQENDIETTAILRHWQDAVPDDRMAHLVKDTWRGLTRAFQARLSEHGVLFGHWVFLRVLWEQDGITQTELSTAAGLMLPTTHTALIAMERLGYITRVKQRGAGHRVFIHLTPMGQAMREPLVALAEEVNSIALRGVSPAEVTSTRRTMLNMIKNLAQDEVEMVRADRHVPSTRELGSFGRRDR